MVGSSDGDAAFCAQRLLLAMVVDVLPMHFGLIQAVPSPAALFGNYLIYKN